MKEILIPLNFTPNPVVYDTEQSFSTADASSAVLAFSTTEPLSGVVASLTIKNISQNANLTTVLIDRIEVSTSPFRYTFVKPLATGDYYGEIILKRNLEAIGSAQFTFGVNSSLSAEVLPHLIQAYSLDDLVEQVEAEINNLKAAYNLNVESAEDRISTKETTITGKESIRALNETQRKANELTRIAQELSRVAAEGDRQETFTTLVDTAVIEQVVVQEVAEKYIEIEATQASRLLSAEQQLADIELLADTTAQKADAMASGSPKGVYATLALLQAAYPTGTTGAYLVTADGKWYYWSGSAWTIGGLYQATSIADNSVTGSKIALKTIGSERLRLPNGRILGSDKVTVNFTTKKITFARFLMVAGFQNGSRYSVSNHVEVDFSAINTTSNEVVVYFDPDLLAFKVCAQWGLASLDSKYMPIAYMFENILYTYNNKAFKTIGSTYPNYSRTNLAMFSSRDYINFDFDNNVISVPSSYIVFNDKYYWKMSDALAITNLTDGASGLYFNISTLTFVVSHNADLIANGITGNENIVLLATFWYMQKTAFAPMSVKVNGYFVGQEVGYKENEHRLLLSPKMFFVDGQTLPLYKQNIFSSNANNLDIFKTCLINVDGNDNPSFKYFYEDIALRSEELENTFKISVKQYADPNYGYYGDITKHSVPESYNTGKTPKIINIGDSLTNRGISQKLQEKLSGYGASATMIGTMLNQGGVYGEGREGWEFENFIGMDNTNISTPITRQTNAGVGSLTTNPFLKLADSNDKTNHGNWCFRNTGSNQELSYADDVDKTGDFYIFDFANYLSVQGFVTPDVVTIALSTNDILQDNVDALAQSRLALEIMIKQIKTACPDCKVGVIPSPVWASNTNGNVKWKTYSAPWIENCMTDILNYQSTMTGIDVVPIWCHVNADFNFPTNTPNNLSSVNQTKKAYRDEYIHWSITGLSEYINALTAYVMNVI